MTPIRAGQDTVQNAIIYPKEDSDEVEENHDSGNRNVPIKMNENVTVKLDGNVQSLISPENTTKPAVQMNAANKSANELEESDSTKPAPINIAMISQVTSKLPSTISTANKLTKPPPDLNANKNSQILVPAYNFGSRPPQLSLAQNFPVPVGSNVNNYLPNHQLPNNGIQHLYANPFAQFSSYSIHPNVGYNPNFAQQPIFGTGQQQYLPQNYYNRPYQVHVTDTSLNNQEKIESQEDSLEELDYEEVDSSSEDYHKIPSKNPALSNINSGNKVPTNYPFYNIYNNPYNPNPTLFIPNQFNANQFYLPNANGFPAQFSAPHSQYNHFNNNPFYSQSVNSFLNQASPNFNGFSNQGNPISQYQHKKPHKKQQISTERPMGNTPNQFYAFDKKLRPFSNQQETETQTKTNIKEQFSALTSNHNIETNEEGRIE